MKSSTFLRANLLGSSGILYLVTTQAPLRIMPDFYCTSSCSPLVDNWLMISAAWDTVDIFWSGLMTWSLTDKNRGTGTVQPVCRVRWCYGSIFAPIGLHLFIIFSPGGPSVLSIMAECPGRMSGSGDLARKQSKWPPHWGSCTLQVSFIEVRSWQAFSIFTLFFQISISQLTTFNRT